MWQNGLANSSNLCHRGITNSNQCQICHSQAEDLHHLFLRCHSVAATWTNNDIQIPSNVAPKLAFKDWLIAWVVHFRKEDGIHDTSLPLFVCTLWSIWCTRNTHLFRGVNATPTEIKKKIDESMGQHLTYVQDQECLDYQSVRYFPPGFLVTNLGQQRHGITLSLKSFFNSTDPGTR